MGFSERVIVYCSKKACLAYLQIYNTEKGTIIDIKPFLFI